MDNAAEKPKQDATKIFRVNTTCYSVRSADRFDGADVHLVADANGVGQISIVSSFFNGGHTFGSFADKNHLTSENAMAEFQKFLTQCNSGYLMQKLLGPEAYVFDSKKTIETIKGLIINDRKSRDISKEEASNCWNEILDLESEWTLSNWNADTFFHELLSREAISRNFPDVLEVGQSKPNPQWDGFWEMLWKPLTQYWQEELNANVRSAPESVTERIKRIASALKPLTFTVGVACDTDGLFHGRFSIGHQDFVCAESKETMETAMQDAMDSIERSIPAMDKDLLLANEAVPTTPGF